MFVCMHHIQELRNKSSEGSAYFQKEYKVILGLNKKKDRPG